MKCPQCNQPLKKGTYEAIAVEKCPQNHGMWLDLDEVDKVEDTVASDDDWKGTMIFTTRETEMMCPAGDQKLRKFNYRFHDLELEYCSNHGYWLNQGEADRVKELMEKEMKDSQRAADVEASVPDVLRRLKNPSFFQNLMDKLTS